MVLDFLSSTDVGRRVPAEEDTASDVSEAELREWLEELEARAQGPGDGWNRRCSYPRRTSWRPRERPKGGRFLFCLFPLSFPF